MSGVQMALRNEAFAAKLALTYAELYDGISPEKQRVSLRINDGVLELKNVETHVMTRWSLGKMREVPDQSDENSMTFAADNYDPARLVVREVEGLRALAKTGARFDPLTGPRGQMIRLALMAILAFGGISGILFGLVPWFANRAAATIPVAAETRLGEQIFGQIYTGRGLSVCEAPEGVAALSAMEQRLTDGFDLPMPLTVQVVRDPTVNATALPGGYVTIHEGLLRDAEDPAEVAAVVAHEIGHVVHRDGTRAHLRGMGSFGTIGLLFGDVFGVFGAAIASQVVDASYSREAERDADAFAYEMMENAGLPPGAMGNFFARLQAEMGPDADMGALRHLSTHPELVERIEASAAAEALSTSSGPPVLSDAQWTALQGICAGGATGEPKE